MKLTGVRRIWAFRLAALVMAVLVVFFMMPVQGSYAAKKKAETKTEESEATKTDESKASDAAKKTEESKATDAAKKTEESKATDAAKKTEDSKATDAAKKTEDSKASDAAKKTEESKASDAAKKTEESTTTDAAKKTETTDAAKKTEQSKKTVKTAEPEATDELGLVAKGAILYCDNIGDTVYAKNEKKKFNPYSVTKIMTCLLAVQHLTLDEEVVISENAAAVGGSTMELEAGEEVTVEDLLYGAILLSGNDAAYALGEAVSGDMDRFVQLMNDTAENIGCENTHFINANGLTDSSQHYTTAYDMMQITRVAFTNQTLAKVAGAKSYKMAATNLHGARNMENHLSWINDDESGIYAAKSGYWSDTKCSLAAAYDKNGMQMFLVLLGDTSEGRGDDVTRMITYAENTIKGVRVIKKGKEVGKVRIRQGAVTSLSAYTSEDGYAYLPEEGAKSLISTETEMKKDVTAPVKAGTVVGSFKILVGDDVVNEVPLIIQEDVEKGWILSYFGISNMVTIFIGIGVLALLVLFLLILIARAKAKRRRQRERERKIRRMAEEKIRRERDREARNWKF